MPHTNDHVQTPGELLVSAAETYPGFQVDNQRPGNWRTENKVASPWQHPSIPWRQGCRHCRRRYHHRSRTQGNVPSLLQPLFHLCIFPPVVCTCLPRIGKETARAGLYYSVSYDLWRRRMQKRLYNTVTVRYRNTRHNIVTTSNKSPGIFHILVTTTQRASFVRSAPCEYSRYDATRLMRLRQFLCMPRTHMIHR